MVEAAGTCLDLQVIVFIGITYLLASAMLHLV